MLSAAWTMAQKDLRSFVRDRSALMLSVLVPIALVTVFGWIMAYAFGGSSGMPKVSLHVADLDQSEKSQQFVEALSSLEMLRVVRIEMVPEDAQRTDARLTKLIRDGDAHHVLVLPESFDRDVAEGRTPAFQMLRDPGRNMEDRIVQLAVMQATFSQLNGILWVDATQRLLQKQGMDPAALANVRSWMTDIGATITNFADEKSTEDTSATTNASADIDPFDSVLELMSEVVPVQTTDVSPPDRGLQTTYQQAQSVAGMSVMMLLFALTSCGNVLLIERENGTLRRLFAQPISRNSVLLGKFLFVLIVGMAQMTILFAYGEWMFRVGLFRDPVTLLVITLTWVCAAGSFGIFLASVSRSNKQAESLATLLILMMAALGGCWFPLQMMNLPPLMDAVCKSTMTYWAMTGLQGMLWNQLPWYSAKTLQALAWQWTWAVSLTMLSVYFYRRNYCRG